MAQPVGRVVTTVVAKRSCGARLLPCVVPVVVTAGAKIRSGIGVVPLVGPVRSEVLIGRVTLLLLVGVMDLALLMVAVRSDVLIVTGRGGGLGEQRMLPVRTEGSISLT